MDMCRNTANNINFYYITNSVKINENFFNKLKNPVFGPFFLFWGQKVFFWKFSSVMHSFMWISSTMPKFMIQFQENTRTEGRMEGWKD